MNSGERFASWVATAKEVVPYLMALFVVVALFVFCLNHIKLMTADQPPTSEQIRYIEKAGEVMPEFADGYMKNETPAYAQAIAENIKEHQEAKQTATEK